MRSFRTRCDSDSGAHLDDCERCNTFVATLRATVPTLRDLPRRTAPEELHRRVHETLDRERQTEPPTTEETQ